MSEDLEFPKAPRGATSVKLSVGKYKKAIVSVKDRDTLRGVEGVLQYGKLKFGRLFHPMGDTYKWDGTKTTGIYNPMVNK